MRVYCAGMNIENILVNNANHNLLSFIDKYTNIAGYLISIELLFIHEYLNILNMIRESNKFLLNNSTSDFMILCKAGFQYSVIYTHVDI